MFRRGFLCVQPVDDFNTDSVPSRLQWGCFPSALAAAGLERPQITAGQLKRLGLWGAGGGRTDFSSCSTLLGDSYFLPGAACPVSMTRLLETFHSGQSCPCNSTESPKTQDTPPMPAGAPGCPAPCTCGWAADVR